MADKNKAAKEVIRAESVVKILGGNVILYDVNLAVQSGEILGIIGASGSGKTTLLRVLIGFFKPEKGDVFIRSNVVPGRKHELYTSVKESGDAIKRAFGFASQHPSIYMDLTAVENLEYFADLHGVGEGRKRTIEILLKLMDLYNVRHRVASDLSGGMQRRLDIACAMVHRPKILILDEPTADLDPFLRRHIWDMIKKINKQGTTVIVSSHQMPDVEMICDRVAIVHRGKIFDIDTPENIKQKFLSTEDIRIQTYPGKYKKLQSAIKHKSITRVDIDGQELVVTTKDAEMSIKHVMAEIQKAGESLSSLRVATGSLDEVFLQLAEDE